MNPPKNSKVIQETKILSPISHWAEDTTVPVDMIKSQRLIDRKWNQNNNLKAPSGWETLIITPPSSEKQAFLKK